MRFLAWVLVAALLGAFPVALAQAEAAEPRVEVAVAPFPRPIAPLAGVGVTNVTVTVPCALVVSGAPASLRLRAAEFPSWTVPTLSPATIQVDPASCDAASQATTAEAKLVVGVTADGPAFTPTSIRVEASLEGRAGNHSGEDEVPVEAGYFSIVEVRADAPIQTGRPQSQIAYPITIQNFGNANTKIQLDVTGGNVCGPESDTQDCLTVIPPSDLTLESKQTGGKLTATTVNVQVQTPYHNGFVNVNGAVHLSWKAWYALEPDLEGDSGQITLMVRSKGFHAPGPALYFVVGLLFTTACLYPRGRMPPRRP